MRARPASWPTATREGATGYLVGEENRGLEYMFTMMNIARLSIGIQGLSVAESAYQAARDYALTRVQGRPPGATKPGTPIIGHPDVRRMLMTIGAKRDAVRALAYFTAGALDRAKRQTDAAQREESQRLVDLLIPVVKAWSTDLGCEAASLAIQVHGGVGFIEDTGLAQLYRDARIAPIYEGTNGIQANDLVGRKLARDNGAAARDFIAGIRASDRDSRQRRAPSWRRSGRPWPRPPPPSRAAPSGWSRPMAPIPLWHSPAPRPICVSSAPSPAAGSWPWPRWWPCAG